MAKFLSHFGSSFSWLFIYSCSFYLVVALVHRWLGSMVAKKAGSKVPTTKKTAGVVKIKEKLDAAVVVANPSKVSCDSCEQSPGDKDRQSDKKLTVKWHKPQQRAAKNGRPQLVAYGRECYACYYVRWKFWPKQTQECVNKRRIEVKAEDDKFWDVRMDCVQKTKRIMHAGPNTANSTENRKAITKIGLLLDRFSPSLSLQSNVT